MAAPALFLLLLITVGISIRADAGRIRQVVPEVAHPTDDRHDSGEDAFCSSWHFAVETNDAGFWATVPQNCVGYVRRYITGTRYESDLAMVASKSLEFARGLEIAGDGKDAWIFDIDETLLSNLPYYAASGFGGKEDHGKPAIVYKSERRLEIEKEGYRIHGNSGDQWSDLFGFATATRSFKLPNPMYYIP
ncbi:unnamed protein product [Victoria cruziana]